MVVGTCDGVATFFVFFLLVPSKLSNLVGCSPLPEDCGESEFGLSGEWFPEKFDAVRVCLYVGL